MADTRAEKVRWLLANVPDPESGAYFSIPRAASKMRELGYTFADNTLRNVCSGKVEDPSFRICEGIAKLFDISPVFFSSDVTIQDLARQLAAAALLRDAHITNLTFRAARISPEVVDTAIAALEQFRTSPRSPMGLSDAQQAQERANRPGRPSSSDGRSRHQHTAEGEHQREPS